MTTLNWVDWSSMMAKLIKENGQVLHGPSCQELTKKEWEWEEHKKEHSSFMEVLLQRLGPHATAEDILQYDPYEDELQNSEMLPILIKVGGYPRVGRTVCKHRIITPERGQNCQRPSGTSQAGCKW